MSPSGPDRPPLHGGDNPNVSPYHGQHGDFVAAQHFLRAAVRWADCSMMQLIGMFRAPISHAGVGFALSCHDPRRIERRRDRQLRSVCGKQPKSRGGSGTSSSADQGNIASKATTGEAGHCDRSRRRGVLSIGGQLGFFFERRGHLGKPVTGCPRSDCWTGPSNRLRNFPVTTSIAEASATTNKTSPRRLSISTRLSNWTRKIRWRTSIAATRFR